MLEKIKFSIIVPCYNVEKFIERTLKTIIAQTYSDYEVILIDDGSIDKTKSEILKVIMNDERFIYYYQHNSGVSCARNKGIELSTGDYIYFLDGDDTIENDLLEVAKNIFKTKNVDMFSFGYKIYEKNNIRLFSNEKYDKKIINSKDFLRKFIKFDLDQSMCSFILKKNLIKNLRFNEELIMSEDLDFQMRLFLKNDFNIFYSSEYYFNYLVRDGSATKNNKVKMDILNTLDSVNELRVEMLKNGVSEYKEYQIARFFGEMSFFADKTLNPLQFNEIKEKFKKYDYILGDLSLNFKRKNIILFILKISYKIDIRLCFFLFNLRKKIGLKFNRRNHVK